MVHQNRHQNAIQRKPHGPQKVFYQQRLGVVGAGQEAKREMRGYETDDGPRNGNVEPGRGAGNGSQIVQQEAQSPPGGLLQIGSNRQGSSRQASTIRELFTRELGTSMPPPDARLSVRAKPEG